MPSAALRFDRVVLAAAVVLTSVLFTAKSADPVNVIKLTALLLCVIVLVASAAVRVVRLRVAQVPWGLPAAVAVSLLAALTVTTVTAPVTSTAVLGTYGRNSGLLAYASAIVLFLAGLRLLGGRETRVLVSGVVIAGLFTATYGLLQLLGWDSVPWNNPFNPVIAALGNPNFAAGYMGIAAPVAVGGALWKGWDPPWRIACAVTPGCACSPRCSRTPCRGRSRPPAGWRSSPWRCCWTSRRNAAGSGWPCSGRRPHWAWWCWPSALWRGPGRQGRSSPGFPTTPGPGTGGRR
jgi:hypothetical protein